MVAHAGHPRPLGQHEDHFVALYGATWADYLRLLTLRGDRSAPRITYLQGTVEIMSPSFDHEKLRALIGRVVEAYCLDQGIDYLPVGSWTIKRRQEERGVEPDECYVFGAGRKRPSHPDLAIEVVWSAGGLDKLEVYRKLGVPEVWIWEKGRLHAYQLRGGTYHRAARSQWLPELDLALVARAARHDTVPRAIRAFRAALARRRS